MEKINTDYKQQTWNIEASGIDVLIKTNFWGGPVFDGREGPHDAGNAHERGRVAKNLRSDFRYK